MSDAPQSTPAALFLLGASHHTAPLELREKLALTPDKLAAFQQKLAALPGLREFTVLNTCNRVEFYGIASATDTIARLQAEFCAFQNFPPHAFTQIRQHALGPDALRHLLEVSSGLQSQMLGETEILGQIKDAYADAQTRRTVGPILNRVFQKTFQHAKYIRSHTAITEGQISIANVAVDLAQKIFGDLSSTRILLLGAGDIGEKTAKAFQSRGAASLTVASRTMERAMELAKIFNGAALPFETAPHHFADFDIVVCSTAAPHAVVTRDTVAAAMKKRRAQPLFFIDLAMPRDVEPAVAEVENVFTYNLDDLAKIADENLAAREAAVAKARLLAREKSTALWHQIEPHAPLRSAS
ncbi:glutamyl-tRNA reductase [Nibricoccus aquaticus]|uniref:Glutamyl-tRNA reductase n=1 Tax=Nibricoccus aquaticus TaxID=2576891 RepID=A0A290Q9W3_9BACT|nr:glutamyl-tRNA reductase [Nibricoccus aquaticus]ATC65223.1 glutamyl-tRNA reductase [Nibricoccus aquaticus]